ncbi:Uncharacterised protein [Yersinia ruckeri]|uniref:Uncharacterized protein n=1 Tax=Yersinia ruckeri TaxID=29486 RepID=A0A0A8V894_YERRU|nr:Uncharacterized protein YR821_p20050 [Yersinia ruckeri]CEK25750.1 Type I restriction-modification system, DNA-methyltransferase subunit M [Yersinia ruckeri]CNI47663.1 Uncharacterised protein [Yersinia ruckeri]SUQ37527.1 Uncharacterised protein [Yersinia ruckeri]SUQ37655.1 Uncharacterised protein [Yersinia ruckeri]
MAIKKTELYSSLLANCDELRGGMDNEMDAPMPVSTKATHTA